MLKILALLFRKKKKHTPLPRVFATIDFSDSSRLTNAGGNHNKVIKVFKNGQELIRRRRFYTPLRAAMMNQIEEIPMVDLTDGTDHPELDWYHTHNPAVIEGYRL